MSEMESDGIRLHFIKFETQYIERCLEFIQQKLDFSASSSPIKVIKATGGGAYKYFDLITNKLGLRSVSVALVMHFFICCAVQYSVLEWIKRMRWSA